MQRVFRPIVTSVMFCVLATMVLPESSEFFVIDDDITNRLVRAHWTDPFDDTEHVRQISYTDDNQESLVVIREQTNTEADCSTRLLLAIPTDNLSEEQRVDRAKVFNQSSSKVLVSFNFKRIGFEEDSSPKFLDDLQILDLDFEDSWRTDVIELTIQEPSKIKQLVEALPESYEVRIRVKLYGEIANIKVVPQTAPLKVFSWKSDRFSMKPLASQRHFNERWEWVAELCEDEAIELKADTDNPETKETESE